MSSSEMVRLRRQMQRRIRAVVAERRLAREANLIAATGTDQGPTLMDPPAQSS